MIIKELYTTRPDGVKLFLNYSDKGVYIRQNQTDIEYTEAIDAETAPYTYTETDRPIEGETDPDTITKQKATAYDYLTGRSTAENGDKRVLAYSDQGFKITYDGQKDLADE